MTARRPLRLRWYAQKLRPAWWLQLHSKEFGCRSFGYVERESTRPNTYRAVTATGAILRGNNRRRLQAKLMEAVRDELRAVARGRAA